MKCTIQWPLVNFSVVQSSPRTWFQVSSLVSVVTTPQFHLATFSSPQKEPPRPSPVTLHLLSTWLLAAIRLLSVSVDVPILDTSHEWNHTTLRSFVSGFRHLTCFQGHGFFFFTCGVFLFSEFSVVTGFDFLFDSEGV